MFKFIFLLALGMAVKVLTHRTGSAREIHRFWIPRFQALIDRLSDAYQLELEALVPLCTGEKLVGYRRRLGSYALQIEQKLDDALSNLQASRRLDYSAATRMVGPTNNLSSSANLPSTPQTRYRLAQPRNTHSQLSISRIQSNTPRRRWNGNLIG